MKKLILGLGLSVMMAFTMSSCKDLCYDCKGFDDGTISLDDASFCEGDTDVETKDEVEAAVLLYEGFGGTCTKQ